ncbi:hypothetical protein DPMN_057160 [Dreissena polymorpha]|uniref:Uncharacterized protein n=1 Tax=Dreissena polymorpha TaxID=45954 RepID=A0A9D4HTW8_DREPO|nr:hypothetical protein DPMN_057160 [Dreissena polymorpha]
MSPAPNPRLRRAAENVVYKRPIGVSDRSSSPPDRGLAQSGCQAHGGTRSGRLRAASESSCLGIFSSVRYGV